MRHNRHATATGGTSILRRTLLAPTLAVLLLAGCSGGGGTDLDDTAPAALDPARSGAQGLPVPAAAIEGEGEPTNQIYTVPGATYDELIAWYEEQLPAGEPWEQWAWCEQKRFTETLQKLWHEPGTNAILTLLVAKNDPPGIVIARDASGPC
jgi:hypothetical protein